MAPANNPFYKYLFLSLLLGVAIFPLSSCDLLAPNDDEVSCGPTERITKEFFEAENNASHNPTITYLDGNDRHFQWSTDLIEDACIDKHVFVEGYFSLKPRNESPIFVDTKVFASFGGLFETNIPYRTEQNQIDAVLVDHDGDFGLRSAFTEGPGFFRVSAEIVFNTLGDYTQDSIYLREVWQSGEIRVSYNKHP